VALPPAWRKHVNTGTRRTLDGVTADEGNEQLGMIRSGPTFEALAAGMTVYQAEHHANQCSFACAPRGLPVRDSEARLPPRLPVISTNRGVGKAATRSWAECLG